MRHSKRKPLAFLALIAALLNLGLTFLFIVSGVILSIMTVKEHKADNRTCRIVKSNRLV